MKVRIKMSQNYQIHGASESQTYVRTYVRHHSNRMKRIQSICSRTHSHSDRRRCRRRSSIVHIIINIYAFNSAICRCVRINFNELTHNSRWWFLHLSQIRSFAFSSKYVPIQILCFFFESTTRIRFAKKQRSLFCVFQCEKNWNQRNSCNSLAISICICYGILRGECLLCLFVFCVCAAVTSFRSCV